MLNIPTDSKKYETFEDGKGICKNSEGTFYSLLVLVNSEKENDSRLGKIEQIDEVCEKALVK